MFSGFRFLRLAAVLLAFMVGGAILGRGLAGAGRVQFWQVGAVVGLMAGLAGSGMAYYRWARPAEELRAALDRIEAGRPGSKVEARGPEALRAIASHFARVTLDTETRLTEASHWRRDMQGLLSMMPDPIVLADAQRRVILINDAAGALFNVSRSQVANQQIVSVISDEPIMNMLEALLPVGKPLDLQPRELRLLRNGQRMTFQAMARRTGSGNLLLVLRDISAVASSLQMKADFVANASHELRTPISAMKIALETADDVLADDPVQLSKCLSVMSGHLRRLEEMITDLLDLSRAENAQLQSGSALLKTHALFQWVESLLGDQARKKGVGLALDSHGLTEFRGDERLLQLIVRNLVENSLKFTPAGGTVSVSLKPLAGGETIALAVADTGCGIPAEHLDRVFERFYQVDPARSGSAGRGTGLGLAIVKHAVAALRGTVQIQSIVGQGTTVTCHLAVIPEPVTSSIG